MNPLWLRIQAPFAAFRWFQTGKYRGSWPVMPPSALWGLILNFAGIEADKDPVPLRLALGQLRQPEMGVLFQHSHVYTVGSDDKDRVAANHGIKSHIQPTYREIIAGIDFIVGVEAEEEILNRVQDGLAGKLPRKRLPFLGDNNYLIDQVLVLPQPIPATWWTKPAGTPRGTLRLTRAVDRKDNTKTTWSVLQPEEAPKPPAGAWLWIPTDPSP